MIIVTATTITATTPPMMAAVLSEGPAMVVLSDAVVVVHCGSPKELMMTEQLLSTSRRTPCIAMVESVWVTKVSKYANSNEVLVWAVPQSRARNVTNAVVQSINQHCRCGLSAECITEGAFQCFENSEQQVTFRARLCGSAQTNTSLLLAYLEAFVSRTESTIAVQGLHLHVDSNCSIAINTFGDPQCTNTTTTSESIADNTAAIIGGVVAVIVVAVIITIAIAVIKSHRASFSLHWDTR